jgi:2'-5' RNA ligase
VAVPIDEELRSVLDHTVRSLRERPGADAWRWTDAAGWHVTLAFIARTDAATVPGLVAELRRAAGSFARFGLATGGLGAFPSRGRARVLWYGVVDPRRELRRLARAVADACALPDEMRFRGHVTLARARERDGADVADLLDADAPAGRLPVERVVLYRSHLGRGPARYEALADIPLGGGAS